MTIVSAVKSALTQGQVPVRSVSRRFETVFVATEPSVVPADYQAQVLAALPQATYQTVNAYLDKAAKATYVYFTGLALPDVPAAEISKPAPKPTSKKSTGKKGKKAQAVASTPFSDEMEEDEGLADEEPMDIEAPLGDLENL